MKKIVKCECCRKDIDKWGNTRYCSSCAVYLKDLRQKLSHYKLKIKQLNYELYGAPSKTQRLRFK